MPLFSEVSNRSPLWQYEITGTWRSNDAHLCSRSADRIHTVYNNFAPSSTAEISTVGKTGLVRAAVSEHPLQDGPLCRRCVVLRRRRHRRIVDFSHAIDEDFYGAAAAAARRNVVCGFARRWRRRRGICHQGRTGRQRATAAYRVVINILFNCWTKNMKFLCII